MANGHGGKRANAGRKARSEEMLLIERLDEHIDQDAVFQILYELVLKGNIKAIQLYMNYRHGKPRETVSMTVNQETPIIGIE